MNISFCSVLYTLLYYLCSMLFLLKINIWKLLWGMNFLGHSRAIQQCSYSFLRGTAMTLFAAAAAAAAVQ